MHRMVLRSCAVCMLMLGMSVLSVSAASAHGYGPGSPGGLPGLEEAQAVTPPGTTATWGDQVNPAGRVETQLGKVNGLLEAKSETTLPSLSSFEAFPGEEGFAGPEPITVYTACTTPSEQSTCTSQNPGVREQAGLDGCNPCTLYNSSGQVLATGSIDMHWFAARGATGTPGTHQQVALLEHGTGGLADYHGVLTHPSSTDPRCAPGFGTTGFVGCYTGTIHAERCITGWHGPLRIPAGQSACLSPGAVVFGPTRLGQDAELFAEGATFVGPVQARGAEAVSMCESHVLGGVSITGTKGPVLLGEPATGDCAGNTIVGPVSITNNGCATCDANHMDTGAVDVSGDTVFGPLRVTGNVGAFNLGYFAPNKVLGPTVNVGNG